MRFLLCAFVLVTGLSGQQSPALEALIQDADRALTAGPYSVMNKQLTPPSGDKHDYMSVGPYWWPDPAKKDGLPYIRKDGERNPDRNDNRTDRSALAGCLAPLVHWRLPIVRLAARTMLPAP